MDSRKSRYFLRTATPAVLKECTEYEKDYGEGPVSKIAWVFGVKASEDAIDTDVEFEGDAQAGKPFEIAAHTSLATGPNSNFAKLNFPAWVGEGWDGDTDSLIGKEAVVDVTSYETKGGQVRNVIEKVQSSEEGQGRQENEGRRRGGRRLLVHTILASRCHI